MNQTSRKIVQYNLLAIIACFLWSTAFVAVKIGLQYASPLFFGGIRFMISGIMVVPFAGNFFTFLKTVNEHKVFILVVSLFQTFILYGLFFVGMTLVPGALGAIIIGSSPLVTAVVAHFVMHNDKMTISKTISILIGVSGIVLLSVSRKPWTETGFNEMLGSLMLLAGTVSAAFANTIVARKKGTIHPMILNSSQIFLGGLLLFLLSIPIEGVPEMSVPFEFYIALLWLSLLSAVAFSIWFYLLKQPGIKVSEINVWKFIIPVSGAIISWTMLPGESPDLYSLAGMGSVGIAILTFYAFAWINNNKKRS